VSDPVLKFFVFWFAALQF